MLGKTTAANILNKPIRWETGTLRVGHYHSRFLVLLPLQEVIQDNSISSTSTI